jgi:effector-binding domain-containing protein
MKITEPKLDNRNEQPYMGIRTQVPAQKFSKVIPELHSEVMAWMRAHDVNPTGAPFIRYHVINMPGLMDVEMGWPVARPLTGEGRITAGVLPAGKYASLVYTGVKNGITGNAALLEWAAKQDLKWDRWDDKNGDAFGSRYESFLTDPADEPDMAKWETEVAIRLADDGARK